MSSDATNVDTGATGSKAPVSIQVQNVYKCYQVYAQPHDRLKQAVLPRIRRMLGGQSHRYYDEFWALKDVGFEVRRGETVGIIGRNGSGKSTLLQIICGTLTPTAGNIEVNGRVAALLELGSGFNPEFTGRENVYLYGSVLGLDRSEIDAKFKAIETFADIGDFINQPVKTYSSGMMVRLAFAVIAHVDADILVVDEALAVGDAVFTQKCMRFLRNFRARGTLLFVSHDISSVLNLCDRAIWLDRGELKQEGSAQEIANSYAEFTAQAIYGDALILRTLQQATGVPVEPLPEPPTDGPRLTIFDNIANSEGWTSDSAQVISVLLADGEGCTSRSFEGGERVILTVRARCLSGLASPIIGFFVKDRLGQGLFGDNTFSGNPRIRCEARDELEAKFIFRLPLLPNGRYSMTVAIADGDPFNHVQHHWLHDAVIIDVASERLRYGLVGIPFEAVVLNRIIEKLEQTDDA